MAEPGATPEASPGAGGSAWKAMGWVAAGLGAAGLGVGAVFGGIAIEQHHSAQCNANRECLTGPLQSARSAATVSNVGFIAGGALAAVGLGVVIFAPASGRGGGSDQATARATEATPGMSLVLAPSGAGLEVGGTW